MNWSRFKTAGALVIAITMLVGCGDKNTENPTGPGGTKLNDYIVSYKIVGNKMIMESQAKRPASNYCAGTELIHLNDTTISLSDTGEFNLNGNVLRFLYEPETLSVSKAVAVQYSQMIRKGSGTGLIGVWTNLTSGYDVVSGVLTASEQKVMDQNTHIPLFGITYDFEFTSSQVFDYISGETDYAAEYIYLWNSTYYYDTDTFPSDSAKYNVTVKKISSNKVTLTGNKTNEVETITWNILSGSIANFNIKYAQNFTSNNTEHSAYTYYSDPTSCPNDLEPSWYDTFLSANARADVAGAAKRAIHPKWHTGSNHTLFEIFRKPL